MVRGRLFDDDIVVIWFGDGDNGPAAGWLVVW